MTLRSTASARAKVRIGHLYGDLLNLYADRGNILVLTRRCEWRHIAVEVVSIGMGDRIGSGEFDLLFMGGGQDGDQQFLGDDLFRVKADGLRGAVHDGVPVWRCVGATNCLGTTMTREPGLGSQVWGYSTCTPSIRAGRSAGALETWWLTGLVRRSVAQGPWLVSRTMVAGPSLDQAHGRLAGW